MAFISSIPLSLSLSHKRFHTGLALNHQRRMTHCHHHRRRRCNNVNSIKAQQYIEYKVTPESQQFFDLLETPPRIALTREQGKNEALRTLLKETYSFVEVMEIPCVCTDKLPSGTEQLYNELINHNNKKSERQIEWIVITSPESATIFIHTWRTTNIPFQDMPKLAVVGKATGDCLKAVGFDIHFVPTKAIGKQLVKEFPMHPSDSETQTQAQARILYPTSKKASDVIVNGLSQKGYHVERINTYSTEFDEFDESKIVHAKASHIVTFASPSAVKSWKQNVGVHEKTIVACIGQTSATACKEAGFQRIHYPDTPGLDGWMTAVFEAMKVFELDMRKEDDGKVHAKYDKK